MLILRFQVAIERTWMTKLKKIVSDELVDQVTPLLSDLSTVFTALAVRSQNGVRASLNVSGFSWDEASETSRLSMFCSLFT